MGYLKCIEIEEQFLRVPVSSSEDSVLTVSLGKMTPLGSDPVSRDSLDLLDRRKRSRGVSLKLCN